MSQCRLLRLLNSPLASPLCEVNTRSLLSQQAATHPLHLTLRLGRTDIGASVLATRDEFQENGKQGFKRATVLGKVLLERGRVERRRVKISGP